MSNTGKALGQLLPLVWAVVVILIVWQLVIAVFRPHVSLLPPPEMAAREFWTLFASGELFVHAGTSLARVLSAWCITGAIAIPLAILWFGIGEAGKVFVVCVATFFPTLLSTIAGVKRIDPVLIHAGQVLGCTDKASLFQKVILPAALPSIVVGMRISFGTGWAAIIAAELVAARSGLGYLIANGMEILRADKVLVGMAMIGILGVGFDAFFRFLNRRYAWGES